MLDSATWSLLPPSLSPPAGHSGECLQGSGGCAGERPGALLHCSPRTRARKWRGTMGRPVRRMTTWNGAIRYTPSGSRPERSSRIRQTEAEEVGVAPRLSLPARGTCTRRLRISLPKQAQHETLLLACAVVRWRFPSGCKSHPATVPVGSNRSNCGGNKAVEASGEACRI